MKVRKLIEELQKLPKDADVFINNYEHSYDSGGHGYGTAEGYYLSGISKRKITKITRDKNDKNKSIILIDSAKV